MIEDQDYKRYAEQMGFEFYVPKYKEAPGSNLNWGSPNPPAIGDHPTQGPAFSEEQVDMVVRILLFPVAILMATVYIPYIVMKEQPPRIATKMNAKFGTPIWLDKVFFAACIYLTFELGCIIFLDLNPFSSLLMDIWAFTVSSIQSLVLGAWHLLTGLVSG